MNRLTKRRRNPGRLFIQVQDVMNVLGYAKTAAYSSFEIRHADFAFTANLAKFVLSV